MVAAGSHSLPRGPVYPHHRLCRQSEATKAALPRRQGRGLRNCRSAGVKRCAGTAVANLHKLARRKPRWRVHALVHSQAREVMFILEFTSRSTEFPRLWYAAGCRFVVTGAQPGDTISTTKCTEAMSRMPDLLTRGLLPVSHPTGRGMNTAARVADPLLEDHQLRRGLVRPALEQNLASAPRWWRGCRGGFHRSAPYGATWVDPRLALTACYGRAYGHCRQGRVMMQFDE